ncbi:uncharacterized protein LOC131160801 [Malania oleifera]|uniref:uncharacterized protein LOC131160801 n=1 Tax=Malania oleifera TaxID=397392 RepID=UPI0025AE718D|nr:uncharacterized protein LOC131160801 [Malania oleifera]
MDSEEAGTSSSNSMDHQLRPQAKKMLESPDLASIETLVLRLTSEQDSEASHANTLMEFCKRDYPNALSLKLSHLLQRYPSLPTRTRSAHILLSIISKQESNLSECISPMIQTELKTPFLACLRQEESKTILKCLCTIVTKMVLGILSAGGEWPELLNFVVEFVNSDSERLQECALLVFAQLPRSLCKSIVPHFNILYKAFLHCLASLNFSVRVSAFQAVVCLVEQLSGSCYHNQLDELLAGMIRSALQLFNQGQKLFARRALNELILLAKTKSKIFSSHINFVVESMLCIAEKSSVGHDMWLAALEVITPLIEADMLQELPGDIAGRLVSALIQMLSCIEDVPTWHSADILELEKSAGESKTYDLGLSLLDALSFTSQEDIAVTAFLGLLPAYMAAPEWQKRHAGLITLTILARPNAMINKIEQILTTVLNSFQDPHPRVRWAAINAIKQIMTELGPDLQVQYHHKIFPALAAAIDDFQNPRVQERATWAMLSSCKNCSPDILTPYMDNIVSKLLILLQNEKQMLQVGALATLASVASLSEDVFQKYYDTIMPCLKDILFKTTEISKCIVRARSVECITSVAMSVGKEKFSSDSGMVMEVLMSLQDSQMIEGPFASYLLEAWIRLCKCLGSEFVQYLERLMPVLLRFAQFDPHAKELENQSSPTSDEGFEGMEFTSDTLNEKAIACNVLCCCAGELKEDFFPWINPVVDTLVPLLNFYEHYETRMAAVSAMPELLLSAKLAVVKGRAQGRNMSYVQKLVINIVPALLEALHKEPKRDVYAIILKSLSRCIEVSGFLFTKSQQRLIVVESTLALKSVSCRKLETVERSGKKKLYSEEKEKELKQKEEILNQLGDCLGTCITTFQDKFLPFIDELFTDLVVLLDDDKTVKERLIAFCVINGILHQYQGAAHKYYDIYLPFLFKACDDENQDVRQEAAHGIGICAEFGGPMFKPSVPVAVSSLNSVIGRSNLANSDYTKGYDTAVAAFGKICEFHHECINADQSFFLLPSFLSLELGFTAEVYYILRSCCSAWLEMGLDSSYMRPVACQCYQLLSGAFCWSALLPAATPASDFGAVTMGNGGLAKFVGIGDVCLEMSKGTKLVFRDVKHFPNIRLNLISAKLSKDIINAMDDEVLVELWHKRLFHMSEKILAILVKKNLLFGMKSATLKKCTHCLAVKQNRVSFKSSPSKRKPSIHLDVYGPMKTRTLGGYLYFVTFINDHSRKLWVYTLKIKDQVDVQEMVWTRKNVSYDHLRVFGCKAFVHIPKDERSKPDVKTQQCIFLGYGLDVFGYRLYDPVEKKLLQVPKIPPDVPLRRFIRDQNPSTRYSVDEFMLLTEGGELECYVEAVEDEHKSNWVDAMQDEMWSLYENHTIELVKLPKGKRALTNRWIYKAKQQKHTS